MHLTVLAFGLPGDVEPLLALGAGLRAAGHRVRMATHESWRGAVNRTGLEFAPLHGDIRALVEYPAFRAVLDAGLNPVKVVLGLAMAVGPALFSAARTFDERLLADVWQACLGTEALVYGAPLALAAYYAAKANGLPSVGALIQPLDHAPTPAARALWQLVFRGPVNRLLAEHGQPAAPSGGPFEEWRRIPIVYGLSPAVVKRPSRWESWQQMTGYWFPKEAAALPVHVADFIAAGPPPVYVTFGSMPVQRPDRLTAIIVAAAARTGDRVIIDPGWGGLGGGVQSDRVLVAADLPRDLVLPRMRAFVHHGGVMMTADGLRAGVPSVVIPSVLDQHSTAERIVALGVGPAPVPRRRLTVTRLARALHATRSHAMRSAATALAAAIDSDQGVERAVKAIEESL